MSNNDVGAAGAEHPLVVKAIGDDKSRLAAVGRGEGRLESAVGGSGLLVVSAKVAEHGADRGSESRRLVVVRVAAPRVACSRKRLAREYGGGSVERTIGRVAAVVGAEPTSDTRVPAEEASDANGVEERHAHSSARREIGRAHV